MSSPKVDQLRERIAAAQSAARQVEATAAAAAAQATEDRNQGTGTELETNKGAT